MSYISKASILWVNRLQVCYWWIWWNSNDPNCWVVKALSWFVDDVGANDICQGIHWCRDAWKHYLCDGWDAGKRGPRHGKHFLIICYCLWYISTSILEICHTYGKNKCKGTSSDLYHFTWKVTLSYQKRNFDKFETLANFDFDQSQGTRRMLAPFWTLTCLLLHILDLGRRWSVVLKAGDGN